MITIKSDRAFISSLREGIKSELSFPGDKSVSHRAVMFASLGTGQSRIHNLSLSRDNMATVSCFRKLGVKIEKVTDKAEGSPVFVVNGNGLYGLKEPSTALYTANSGTLTRIIPGILCGNPFFSVLYGDKYLNSRPMKRIMEPLRLMGARITGRSGGNYPPLSIEGSKLKSIFYETKVPSAQVKSCIMFAALYAEGTTTIYEKKITRDHTENFLRLLGYPFSVETNIPQGNGQGCIVSIKGGRELEPFEIAVPGDFSSASFFIALGLLLNGSEIEIRNVLLNDKRTGLLKVLKMMGADIEVRIEDNKLEKTGTIRVRHSEVNGVFVPGEIVPDMIDEFPVFSIIASFASGTTRVSGAKELRVKETDRIKAIVLNLTKIGIKANEFEDGFEIEGNPSLSSRDYGKKFKNSGRIVMESFGDHRIAMSMVILGLLIKGADFSVKDVRCVNTSFPEFFDIIKGVTSHGE